MKAISFAGEGLAAELVPSEELADCAGTVLEADGARILSYGTGAGYTPLRELLAERFGVHPYRVWLTNGWLQGFTLLAQGRAEGQHVVVEYPTYDRVLKLLFRARANLIYLDRQEQGLALDPLENQLLTSPRPTLAYLMPTFHIPTGLSISSEQREQLCSALLRARILVVEDDSYGLLQFEGEMLPTLFDLSGQATVYSTSFSLTIAAGLRVGVFCLPEDLAGELATTAHSTYISPVLLNQATVCEFLRRGSFEPHLERLNGALRKRRDTMLAALEKHVPGGRCSRPEGGIFITVQLPPGTNAREMIERAEGVTALAGEDFDGPPNAIRLNFAATTLEEIEPDVDPPEDDPPDAEPPEPAAVVRKTPYI